MLLLLDNYDSFTYNVYQLLTNLGAEVEVARNDVTTVDEIRAKKYKGIVKDSVPESEYLEMLQKAKALFKVVEEVENDAAFA